MRGLFGWRGRKGDLAEWAGVERGCFVAVVIDLELNNCYLIVSLPVQYHSLDK